MLRTCTRRSLRTDSGFGSGSGPGTRSYPVDQLLLLLPASSPIFRHQILLVPLFLALDPPNPGLDIVIILAHLLRLGHTFASCHCPLPTAHCLLPTRAPQGSKPCSGQPANSASHSFLHHTYHLPSSSLSLLITLGYFSSSSVLTFLLLYHPQPTFTLEPVPTPAKTCKPCRLIFRVSPTLAPLSSSLEAHTRIFQELRHLHHRRHSLAILGRELNTRIN